MDKEEKLFLPAHGSREREKVLRPMVLCTMRMRPVRVKEYKILFRGETKKFQDEYFVLGQQARNKKRAKEANARRARAMNRRETIRGARVQEIVFELQEGEIFLGLLARPRKA